jgi:DNA-binding response OmpR family regulator
MTELTLHALIVDEDPASLRYLADALSTFQPGFQVSTATDLERAARWSEISKPDIVVAGLESFSGDELEHWSIEHAIDPLSIIGLSTGPSHQNFVRTIVHRPISLPDFLDAVHGVMTVTHRSDGTIHPRSTQTIGDPIT